VRYTTSTRDPRVGRPDSPRDDRTRLWVESSRIFDRIRTVRLSSVGAGIAATVGVVSTLTILMLLFAGAPNSSPAQWVQLRNAMFVAGLGGIASLVAAIVLIGKGRSVGAAWIGALPFFGLVGLIAYAM
jgi:hypothetical protein